MKDLFQLLKGGNRSSLIAAIVNFILGTLKGVVFFFTGNVALFAEMMHSLGDSANQFFVFFGSALSKKSPTQKFPKGFGRLVNLVCLGAVLIVGILAYETIKEGWHHIWNPTASSGFWLSIGVLAIGVVMEGIVFYKAAQEIAHEVGIDHAGLKTIPLAIRNVNRAKPATKLVFMEDFVATFGGVLAIFAIILAQWTGFHAGEGIASVIIGIMMFYVVGRVFLDNARGVIGETDEEMLNHIAYLVLDHPDIIDIERLDVVKEGEFLHVELVAEVNPNHSLAYLDDVRDTLTEQILYQKGVNRVIVSFDEDDGEQEWHHREARPLLS
ncbi:cation transporter [Savagea sp. SN6]|uniref:Cation transporter n=1 Tax=Savagea serpentis TaxID=2785297 RepID=A0A8J7G3B8_9BACL|nr:cation diffusion facilitator family transporter [Savagea serpentis]MBF4500642.1 cation transporter [Savagea serpentis]